MQGIADRTGINLPTMPDLPYAGILGLLTGGAGNLGAYALKSLAGQAIPKAIDAIDPELTGGLKTAEQTRKTDNLDYKNTMLDKIFGQVPQAPTQTSVQPNVSSTDFNNQFFPSATNSPVDPSFNISDFINTLPTMNAPNISPYLGDFSLPDISNFQTQFEPPAFDYSAFEFRNGGKV
jgi:hypothetical protein